MRTTITLLTLLQSVLLFAQTADVTSGCAPLTVAFTAPAGANTYFWDFKDGGTSTLQKPSKIFTAPGKFVVEFRTVSGGPVVGTVTITVFPKPDLGMTAVPASGCVPLNVQFTDTSVIDTGIKVLSYGWVFGDGGGDNVKNPSHTYTLVGNFTVSLEITTNFASCNVTEVFQDAIKTGKQPLVAFTTVPSPAVACDPPLNVSFTNTTTGGSGSLTYLWDFNNGNTSILVNPPAQNYTQNGNYTVILTATDAIGCSATITRPVTIGHPTADFTVFGKICKGEPVLFTNNSSPGNYSWNFGPNAVPPTSFQQDPATIFGASGNQNVTLTVTTGNGCTSSVTKQIFVDEANANFTVVPSYSCSDPTTFSLNATSPVANEWDWQFSNGTTSDIKNPVFKWTTPDTTGYSSLGLWLDTIRLTVTNPSGCTAEFFRVDSIWRPNAKFIPDIQHGCAPLTVTFTDTSISKETIVQWTWLFDDGSAPLIKNNDSPTAHTFTQPGDYKVRLIIRNSAGCIDTSYAILIEVGVPIPGDFTADQLEVCPGDTVQFTNLTTDPRVDGWHFSSESHRFWHCFQDKNPSWIYNSEAGPMDVSLTTEYNGCFFTVTKNDYILTKGPIAQLHYKTTCANTLEFTFMDESYDAPNIKWYLGDGDSTTDKVFTHLYDRGSYQVVLVAENPASGCPISRDTAIVYATTLKSDCAFKDTICGGEKADLDGSKSLDVNATCFKGYTWYFSFQRPIRTDSAVTPFTFGPPGEQWVCLEVEDINGCRDTLCDTLFIINRNPDFLVSDDTICIPATVSFTDLSSVDPPDFHIVKWEWDFGDGSTSTQKNPTHTFTTPPPDGERFTVQLRVEDDHGCPAFVSKTIEVYKPKSNILPQPPAICAGNAISFAATYPPQQASQLSWKWDFGNGNTFTGQGSNQLYTAAGQYTVKMVYTEIATGCKDSMTTEVTVQDKPHPSFTTSVDPIIAAGGVICSPQNILFNNTSTPAAPNSPVSSVFWKFGNGSIYLGNPGSAVYTKGAYTATMIVATSLGCTDSTTVSFTVVGPEGKMNLDKHLICLGDTVAFTLTSPVDVSSWTWDFDDGDTSKLNPVKHRYTVLPSNYFRVAKLVLYGQDPSCTLVLTDTVKFSRVNADFVVQDPSVCLGKPHSFFATSPEADVFQWTFGDGGTGFNNPASHTYAAQGNYIVQLIVTDLPLGCKDTSAAVSVQVTGIPGLVAFGDTICPGDIGTIGVNIDGATYTWSPANLVMPPKGTSVVNVTPTQTTSFVVEVVDAQNCRDTAVATVLIPVPFTGGADWDTIVGQGVTVELPLTLDPLYNFTWAPPPGPSGNPPTVVTADTSIHYVLTVTDIFGCTEKEIKYDILVVPEKVFAPNAFTPDHDGNNDVFYLKAVGEEGLVEVLSLRVYNRWGQKVYEGSGPLKTTGWDGKVDGKEAPSDVYVWVADLRFLTGRNITMKGDVSLLR